MYKKQIGQQILFLLSIIFMFVFILVRVDSLQYLNLIMPERGIVTVCTVQCSGEPRSPLQSNIYSHIN